jgi:hypothetical protein
MMIGEIQTQRMQKLLQIRIQKFCSRLWNWNGLFTIPVKSWHRLDLTGSPVGVFMAFPVDGKMKKFYVRDHPRSALAAHLENGWLIINTHLSFVPGFNLLQLIKIKRWANKLGVSKIRARF